MSENQEKKYIGVDVSKFMLDICWGDTNFPLQFSNTSTGIKSFISILKKSGAVHIIVEATGGYEKQLKDKLQNSNLLVSVVNPRWVRDFAKSRGILSKTDKIDAFIIREFGCVNKPEATTEKALKLNS